MLTTSGRTTSQTAPCTSIDDDQPSSMVSGDSRHSSVDRRRANTADTTAENRVLSASERDALLRQLDVTYDNIVRDNSQLLTTANTISTVNFADSKPVVTFGADHGHGRLKLPTSRCSSRWWLSMQDYRTGQRRRSYNRY